MSWLAKLAQTYDQAMALDVPQDAKPIPMHHTVQNAHINVTIDTLGNFLSARVLDKTQIVLPATEKSAGRSSGEAAHPLADKVQYCAGDYATYGGTKSAYFSGYLEQLEEWCASLYSHPSAVAVKEYVRKGSLVADLVQTKVAVLDENDILRTSWGSEDDPPPLLKILPKEKGSFDQGNALVCWSVESNTHTHTDTWLDQSLQQAWVDFENSKSSLTSICAVSGLNQPIALSHPAKIRHSGDKAKLISSNDLAGFTFKGRFTDSKKSFENDGLQGVTVGQITTQKAHNALRWLVGNRHAHRNGDQVIVAWAVSGNDIPDPLVETDKLDLDDFSEVSEPASTSVSDSAADHSIDLGKTYAKSLKKLMAGYSARIDPTDTVAIMAIDSATPGRMGIVYYREYMPEEYLEKLFRWHSELAWPQRFSREIESARGKPTTSVEWATSAPSIYSIAQGVYGPVLKGNDTLKKLIHERLMPCVLEAAPIPIDVLNAAINRASNPAGKENWEWEKCLGITCSLYRGFHIRHPKAEVKKEFSVALENDNTSRDYLYGRLLAIAEWLEEIALRVTKVNRPTTANRLMQRFADRPYSTWLTIYKQLDPYLRQLKTSRTGFLTNMMKELDEVMSLFNSSEFKRDTKLSGEFLLGFHAQRLALREKSNLADPNANQVEEEQDA